MTGGNNRIYETAARSSFPVEKTLLVSNFAFPFASVRFFLLQSIASCVGLVSPQLLIVSVRLEKTVLFVEAVVYNTKEKSTKYGRIIHFKAE